MLLGLLIFSVLAVATVDPDDWRGFANRVKEMFRIHDIPWTKGAKEYMGIDAAQFQRALDGEAKFDYRRIYMLPRDMRATLNLLELQAHGLPLWAQKAVAMEKAVAVSATFRTEVAS